MNKLIRGGPKQIELCVIGRVFGDGVGGGAEDDEQTMPSIK